MKLIRGRFLLDPVHPRHKSLAKFVGLDLYMENTTFLFIFYMHMLIRILSDSKLANSRSILFTLVKKHMSQTGLTCWRTCVVAPNAVLTMTMDTALISSALVLSGAVITSSESVCSMVSHGCNPSNFTGSRRYSRLNPLMVMRILKSDAFHFADKTWKDNHQQHLMSRKPSYVTIFLLYFETF